MLGKRATSRLVGLLRARQRRERVEGAEGRPMKVA